MMTNVYVATREAHKVPLKEARSSLEWGYDPTNAINRGDQKTIWESDTVVVPKIAGNAEEGKDGTQLGPRQGNTYYKTRIGEQKWKQNLIG